jgi:RHS repeat-associated protein
MAAPTHPPPGRTCGLQNLHYTYDPAGNITHIQDDAQQTIFFRNTRVEPSNDYTYDALYRLIQATGREHLGQTDGKRNPPSPPDAFNTFHTRMDHPGDGNAMGTYTEQYVYDAVGNFKKMRHRGSDPEHPPWTRVYDYEEVSLIEKGSDGTLLKASNRLTRTKLNANLNGHTEPCHYDAHGNTSYTQHLGGGADTANMHWDYKDRLRQVDLGADSSAVYVYNADGQRVRKIWNKAPGPTDERIYLGGFEIHRTHVSIGGQQTITRERETVHLMDDKQRIALIETRTVDTAGTDRAPRQLIRHQFGNHLGSASLELDERAQIISYEEYRPYGCTSYQAVRSQTESPKRYLYTGKERDEGTGFYYYGARYYAPWIARWTSCDPTGADAGLNLYSYVSARPTVMHDPDGRDEKQTWLMNQSQFTIRPVARAADRGITPLQNKALSLGPPLPRPTGKVRPRWWSSGRRLPLCPATGPPQGPVWLRI